MMAVPQPRRRTRAERNESLGSPTTGRTVQSHDSDEFRDFVRDPGGDAYSKASSSPELGFLTQLVSMHILMRMASRNVYVSADDVELFDRATALAGGLSAAVATGLRLYVAEREREERAGNMKQIEVEVQAGAVATVKRFVGRRVLRYEHRDGARRVSYRVYATANGQFAVYRRDDPDWSTLTSPDENNPVWQNPSTWNGGWWEPGDKTLSVFADTNAMVGELPDNLIAAVEAAVTAPEVEALDI